MNAVIVFDLSEPSATSKVVERLKAIGYHSYWMAGAIEPKKRYNLPHNMVWKQNAEMQQAKTDLERTVEEYRSLTQSQVRVTRCIILNSTPWGGIEGDSI
jgi:hypothetical protein